MVLQRIRRRPSVKRIINSVVWLAVRLTWLLPTRFWLRIREESGAIGKLDYARGKVYICVDSLIENDVRLHSCAKEPDTIEWIESWFKPGDVFFDIGANVGAYSLVANSFLNGQTTIYAFEPGFITFPQLCKNIHLNDAAASITPFQVALSNEASVLAFHYQNLVTGGALHALGEPLDQHGHRFKPVFTLPTLTYKLDSFITQFGLPTPNHIKIDVDGIEYQILKGAEATLGRPELQSILIELDEEREESKQIVQLLTANQFVPLSRGKDNCVYGRKDQQAMAVSEARGDGEDNRLFV